MKELGIKRGISAPIMLYMNTKTEKPRKLKKKKKDFILLVLFASAKATVNINYWEHTQSPICGQSAIHSSLEKSLYIHKIQVTKRQYLKHKNVYSKFYVFFFTYLISKTYNILSYQHFKSFFFNKNLRSKIFKGTFSYFLQNDLQQRESCN